MFVIVGLGNPGEQYEKTRHNAGRNVLSFVMKKNGLPDMVRSNKYAGFISEGVLGGEEVLFLFPETYMNKSGSSVMKVVTEKEDTKKLIVVYDDVDLPVGDVKISFGKGSGGHNGIESIIKALGTKDFTRIRVGIASKSFWTGKARRPAAGVPMTSHVLGDFKKREVATLVLVYEKVDDILKTILKDGVEKAMNQFN